MSISDTQFTAWLRTNGARCVLADMTFMYENATVPTTGTARLSNRTYITEPGDTPGNAPYHSCISKAPDYERLIDQSTLGGAAPMKFGSLVINNGDGKMDWVLDAIIDGQPITFKLGYGGDDNDPKATPWAYADFRTMFTCFMQKAEISRPGEITVTMRDASLPLEKYLTPALIGGGSANAAKYSPIVYGAVDQVEAVAYDTTNLIYRWTDAAYIYATHTVIGVYDNGASLDVGTWPAFSPPWGAFDGDLSTDRVTITAWDGTPINVNEVLIFSAAVTGTLSAGIVASTQYWITATNDVAGASGSRTVWVTLSATRGGSTLNLTSTTSWTGAVQRRGWYANTAGTFQLSAAPVGTITMAGYNYATDGGAYDCFAWAAARGGVTPSQHASYGLLSEWSLAIVLTQPTKLNDIMGQICTAAAAFWTTTDSGGVQIGCARTGTALTSLTANGLTFTDDSVLKSGPDDKSAKIRTARMLPQFTAISVWFGLNYPPLTQTVGVGLLSDDFIKRLKALGRGFYAEVAPTSGAYTAAPGLYHVSMVASPEMQVVRALNLSNINDWTVLVRERLRPHVDFAIFSCPIWAYTALLGDRVTAYLPRYLRDTTTNDWQVLGKKVMLSDDAIELTLMRRRVPDSVTGTH